MPEAVQAPVRSRDAGGTVEAATITAPWQPRGDGKRAILVNQRATVFDRLVTVDVVEVDPAAEFADPIWDHHGLQQWTPDLVHCRLLLTGEIVRRLPPVLKRGVVSQLGSIAVSELAADRRIPPTAAEISMADWTLVEIASCKWRQIVLACAFGFSSEKITKAFKAKGELVSRRTVQRRYGDDRLQLAARWQGLKAPVDRVTAGRWLQIFDKAEK